MTIKDYSLLSVRDLKPGDHLCCIYGTEQEHRELVAPFLIHGLEQNQKVFYIVDRRTADTVIGYLRDRGVDAGPYLESRQLSILTAGDAYMAGGTFDPDRMIGLLESETEIALEEGYSALRVTGEMSWALRGLPGSERLIEYEAKLNRFFPDSKCMAVCQYDRRMFEPAILISVIATHPLAVIGNEIFDNFYFVPPDEFLAPRSAEPMLERMIDNLVLRKRAQESLEKERYLVDAALDVTSDMVAIFDLEGNLIQWNRSGYDVFGYSDEELSSSTIFDILDEGDVNQVAEAMEAVRESGSASLRVRLRTRDGKKLLYEVAGNLLRDPGGRPMAVIGIGRDVSERDKYEKALRKSEENLRTIIDSVPGIIFYKDTENRFLRANRTLASYMGMEIEELEGSSLWDLFPREQAEAFYRDDLEVIESGQPKLGIMESYETPRGTRRARTDKVPYRDVNGDIAGVIGFSVDVTEELERERALSEAERKYRELAESLPQVLFELDPQGNITYANRSAYRIFGYTPQDIEEGMNALDVISPDDRERVARAVWKMYSGESTGAVREYLARRKDGSEFPCIVYSSLITDAEGNPAGIRGILTDITERKKAEEALRESEERYRDLFENASDLIQSVTPDGRFLYVNKSWKATLGYGDEELEDLTLFDVIHPDSMEHCMKMFEQVMSGKEITGIQARFLTKQGSEVFVEGSANCRFENGEPVSTRGIFRDVTGRRLAEEELKRVNEELSGFAHTVSHDLKGPLSAIDVASDTLGEIMRKRPNRDEEDIDEIIEIIEKNVKRSARLIEDLLALAEAGQVPEEVRNVDVGEIVDTILEERAFDIEKRGVSVTVDDELGSLRANRTQIYQLFSNLIGNAIRHNDSEKPRIEVSRLDSGGYGLKYLVADNGPGIPESIEEKVFDPFSKGLSGETGIGLSIVQKIVKLYNGEIRVYNDNGACFEFSLRGLRTARA